MKFPKSSKYDKANDIPGPGAYDYTGALKGKSGGYSVGKAPRNKGGARDVPGPGAYDADFKKVASTQGNIKFGKSGNNNRINDVPGPGAYDYTGVDSSKNRGIKIGREIRDRSHNSDIPGPGSYNGMIPDGKGGFRFAKSAKGLKYGGDGPEFYDIPHSIPDVPSYNYPPKQQRKIKY